MLAAGTQYRFSRVSLPFSKPEISQDYLSQLVHGILHQLKKDSAELIGGHTAEGEELTIGFTVNGLGALNRLREKINNRARSF